MATVTVTSMAATTIALAVPQMLTADQVAEALQVSKSTLYQWWRRGDGPRRIQLRNGSFRVHPDWLADYLLSLEVGAA